MSAEKRYVVIYGQVCDYEEKAPFLISGESILGALEYELGTDRLKCHECGEWRRSLSQHIATHKIKSFEYKLKHGLRLAASLLAPRLALAKRSAMRQAIRSGARIVFPKGVVHLQPLHPRLVRPAQVEERQNLQKKCRLQCVARMAKIAGEIGRTPTARDLKERDPGLMTAIESRFGSICLVQELAGLVPNTNKTNHYARFSKTILTELLRDFQVLNGRVPKTREFGMILPSRKTFCRYFGNLANAYIAAGLVNYGIRSVA